MKKQLKNKKIRLIYFIIIGINIVLFTIPNVYAEENPVVFIDRLSTMIYQMIALLGGIITGLGIVQFSLSLKGHDSTQKLNAFFGIVGGIMMICAKYFVNWLTK